MARRTEVVVTIVDDLDGTTLEEGAGETVQFALDGVSYEIDLSRANAAALREAFAPYLKAGRTAGGARRGGRSSGRAAGGGVKEDLKAAREWLRAQGHEVSERGRIPGHLLDEYRAKH